MARRSRSLGERQFSRLIFGPSTPRLNWSLVSVLGRTPQNVGRTASLLSVHLHTATAAVAPYRGNRSNYQPRRRDTDLMWPWGHAAVGFVCYYLYSRVRGHASVPSGPTVALGVGTQLPDMIDKPLAWQLGLLPNGRSLGHSVLIAVAVVTVVWLLRPRVSTLSRPPIVSFAIGYFTHLFGDALYPLLGGEWYYLGFLGWPIVPPVDYPPTNGVTSKLLGVQLTPSLLFELLLLAVALRLWWDEGRPGVDWLTEGVRSLVRGREP